MGARTPLVLSLLSLITLAAGVLDVWTRPQSQPQTLHSLMVSIDERLHSLENAKLDSTLREMDQRLESLESTFRRLDTTFQDRLDKLERNLNSKEIKDELTVEKLSHKVRDILDISYDRYSRRLGYTEERLEMSLKKVQMSVEGILNRIEKQQEDIQTDVTETVAVLEDLKTYSTTTDDKLNSTHKAMQQHIQSLITPSRDELQRISGSLDHIGSRLNGSLGMWGSQNDGPQVGDVLSTIRAEINTESTKLTSKMNNMYNEMWMRMVSVESLLKDLSRLSNMTRQEVLEEVRSLVPSDHRDFPGDSQENFLEVALDALERKLQKVGRNIDDRMDSLTARQDLFLDSCFEGGMCRGLESRLSHVLERIFDIFSDKIEGFTNRTFNLDGMVMEMMELVKSQHSHLIRTVTHNTNMVVTLAKDNSDANKMLHHDISQLNNNFQELHDEIDEASNSSRKVCTENTSTTEEQKPPQVPSKNITEVKFIPLNTTEEPIDVSNKHYDVGVLKITTDNFEILADNVSLPSEKTDRVEDSSIMHIISTISPNLTSSQIDSLLWVLNNSISFDNLEAIIQADTTVEGGSIEIYDSEPLKKTNSEDDFGITGNESMAEVTFSGEKDNVPDETNDVSNPDSTTENIADDTIVINVTEITDTGISVTTTNKTGPKSPELSADLKDELKVYAFLWKLKHGYVNMTILREQLEKSNESVADTVPVQLSSALQKLCYGKEKHEDVTSDNLDTIVRDRLLLISQTLNDTDLYEKIENICNILTESLHRQNITRDGILQLVL